MARIAQRLGSALDAVGAANNSPQLLRAVVHIGLHQLPQSGRGAEQVVELHDVRRPAIDIGDDPPLGGFALL